MRLLKEAVVNERMRPDLSSMTWEANVLLEKVFVYVIREFIHRNNYKTQTAYASASKKGGGERPFDDVLDKLRENTKELIPVFSGTEASYIAAYKNKKELGSEEYGTTYAFDDP